MLKPLHDNVVLKEKKPEKTTKSGIILTSDDTQKPNTAQVISVGPGTSDHKMSVNEGDIVVYKNYAPTDIEIDGEKYLVIKESDILAIMEDDMNE